MSKRPLPYVAAATASILGTCMPLLAAEAHGPLPEGVGSEVTALHVAIRVASVCLAAFLLVAGRRFDRSTAGSFFLLASIGIAWPMLGSSSYAAAAVAAFLGYAAGMLVLAFVPRLAMAIACSWPLAAIYAAHIYFSGSFFVSWWLFICLLLAGLALGATFPKAAVTVVSSALGTTILWLALPWELGFFAVTALFAAGVIWQALFLNRIFAPSEELPFTDVPSLRARRSSWFGAMKAAALIMIVGAFAFSMAVPRAKPVEPRQQGRVEALRKEGALSRPGLLFSPADAFYLCGRPLPIALVGGGGTFMDRLTLPILGHSPSASVHRLRAIKDPEELETMRRAAAITSKAFETIAPMIKPGVNEKEIERAILGSFEKNGANGIAFPCIVGSGHNATLPHYMANDAVMNQGLVVIDIGCAVNGYASDMTRTFPVKGKYTASERKLIETLVQAGDAARSQLKAGASYLSLDKAAREVITKAGFGQYFNHGLGHPVGLDVHDPYQDKLQAGMVVTIEPGIYIPPGAQVNKSFWDLGARIEDSYIVTATGFEEITSFPKIPPERPPSP